MAAQHSITHLSWCRLIPPVLSFVNWQLRYHSTARPPVWLQYHLKSNTVTDKARVYLAPLQQKHIDRYIQLSGDAELIATMGWKPFGLGETDEFLQRVQAPTLPYCGDGKPTIFSIMKTPGDKAIGFVTINGINETMAAAEIGIAIMERAYRGQGYGTEALRLAAQYAFDELNLSLLGLTVFLTNRRAIRAYERVGFQKKGTLKRSWLMPDGEYVDMWLMELTRDRLARPEP